MTPTLIEAIILGLSSFTLLGVIALKVDLARLFERQEVSKEKISKLEANVDELWEVFHAK